MGERDQLSPDEADQLREALEAVAEKAPSVRPPALVLEDDEADHAVRTGRLL